MKFQSEFIHENAVENVVCEMASILSRPQWVNTGCIHSIVTTDAMVLKHQAISIHSAHQIAIASHQF